MKNFDAEGFGQHAFLVWLIVAVAPAFLLGYWLSKRKRKAIKGE
jgi:heme exporter protein D